MTNLYQDEEQSRYEEVVSPREQPNPRSESWQWCLKPQGENMVAELKCTFFFFFFPSASFQSYF